MATANEVVTPSAAAKVFDTFELLENVPSRVTDFNIAEYTYRGPQNLRTLYRFQRVNSTFRNVIARSKKLRTAMFREYEPGEERIESCNWTSDRKSHTLLPHLNPLIGCLDHLRPVASASFFLSNDDEAVKSCGVELHGAVMADECPEVASSAPWRELLICNVPVRIKVRFTFHRLNRSKLYSCDLNVGATLGTLVDLVIGSAKIEERYRRKQMGYGEGEERTFSMGQLIITRIGNFHPFE